MEPLKGPGEGVPGWLRGLLPGKPVELPVSSRDARRVAERLEPRRGAGFFVWLLCKSGSCRLCVVFGREYSVVVDRVRVRDPLSGLVMRLPVPRGVVDGRVVWEARWRRGLLWVDGVSCDAVVTGGLVECRGRRLSAGCDFECVREACLGGGVTRGP